MDLTERITGHFSASIAAKQATLDSAAPAIVAAALTMAQRLKDGGKILCCGNGGSAADAQHFASELVNRFEIERRGLPAIALTTNSSILTSIANDHDYSQVYAKPVLALGTAGDLLLALSTSGRSANVNRAVEAAHDAGMTVIALTGRNGGELGRSLTGDDIEIRASSDSTARIQEVHELILHCLCDLIDQQLFAPKE